MPTFRILGPLRTPGLRRLWPGQVAALLASEIHLIAIAWLALELTGSGLALGTVLGVGLLPRIVLTLLGGVASDRFGHRRILRWCNGARAVCVGLLATSAALGAVQMWHLYLAVLTLGAISSFYAPALFSAVPRECPPEELKAGNALMRGTAEAAGVIGPVTGGGLVAAGGAGSALWVVAGSYFTAWVTMVLFLGPGSASLGPRSGPVPPAGTAAVPSALRRFAREMGGSLASVRRDTFLARVLVLIGVAAVALTGPITVGTPWLAREEFGRSPWALGLLLAMWTSGSLVGVLAVGSARTMTPSRPLIAALAVIMTLSLTTLGLFRELPVAAAALFLMGSAAGAFNIVLITWLQERADPERMGRLMSLAELAELIASPISYLVAGMMMDISVAALFLGAAIAFLIGAMSVILPRRARAEPP